MSLIICCVSVFVLQQQQLLFFCDTRLAQQPHLFLIHANMSCLFQTPVVQDTIVDDKTAAPVVAAVEADAAKVEAEVKPAETAAVEEVQKVAEAPAAATTEAEAEVAKDAAATEETAAAATTEEPVKKASFVKRILASFKKLVKGVAK